MRNSKRSFIRSKRPSNTRCITSRRGAQIDITSCGRYTSKLKDGLSSEIGAAAAAVAQKGSEAGMGLEPTIFARIRPPLTQSRLRIVERGDYSTVHVMPESSKCGEAHSAFTFRQTRIFTPLNIY
jgi:hypothetical protein